MIQSNSIEYLVNNEKDDDLIKERKEIAVDKPLPMKRANQRVESLPLTHAQQRIWFLEQLDPTAVYHQPLLIRLEGILDFKRLVNAYQTLIQHHESLRTVFRLEGGEVRSVVLSSMKTEIPVIDLSDKSLRIRQQLLMEKVRFKLQQPIPIEQGSLCQAMLFRMTEEEAILFICIHRLIADERSLELIYHRLLDLFADTERPDTLVPYHDYVRDEQQYWIKPAPTSVAYWHEHLSACPPILQMPYDYPQASLETKAANSYYLHISNSIVEQITDLATEIETTPETIWFAIVQLLLARYTGQKQVIMGAKIANRARLGDVIGCFANTLPIHTRFTELITFRQLIDQVKQHLTLAVKHRLVPLEQLGSTGHNGHELTIPPIQVICDWKKRLPEREIADLIFQPIKIESIDAHFDVAFSFEENEYDEWILELTYRHELFRADTIKRMGEHLLQLIKECIDDIDQAVFHCPILTKSERQQLVGQISSIVHNDMDSLHQLFERQVKVTPHLTAVIDGHRQLTFHQLEEESNRLAHLLLDEGIGSEEPVGVWMDRSLEMVITVLAISKVGGAYVPLDRELSKSQVLKVLSEVRSSICCVTHNESSMNDRVHLIDVIQERTGKEWKKLSTQRPINRIAQAEQTLAIFIQTSLQNKHKAVVHQHRGWVERIRTMQDSFGLQAGESLLLQTSLSFPESVIELFWPLTTGGCIVLVPPSEQYHPRTIIELGGAHQVVYVQLLPHQLRQLLYAITDEDRAHWISLRTVVSYGEWLTSDLVNTFIEQLSATLYNAWGVSEATAFTTIYRCTSADADSGGRIPIGSPIEGHQVYVLDDCLQPVPRGVAGDLYLAGVGLAKGYLHDEAQTNRSFIPDHVSACGKMYRTGDRGVLQADGSLYLIGKSTQYVEQDNVRVDYGEIEAMLLTHEQISEAVVVNQMVTESERLLIAYLVLHSNAERRAQQEMLTWLRRRLTDRMIPPMIIFLQELPRDIQGRIQVNELPVPLFTK